MALIRSKHTRWWRRRWNTSVSRDIAGSRSAKLYGMPGDSMFIRRPSCTFGGGHPGPAIRHDDPATVPSATVLDANAAQSDLASAQSPTRRGEGTREVTNRLRSLEILGEEGFEFPVERETHLRAAQAVFAVPDQHQLVGNVLPGECPR